MPYEKIPFSEQLAFGEAQEEDHQDALESALQGEASDGGKPPEGTRQRCIHSSRMLRTKKALAITATQPRFYDCKPQLPLPSVLCDLCVCRFPLARDEARAPRPAARPRRQKSPDSGSF
jgi:hypothetical protein